MDDFFIKVAYYVNYLLCDIISFVLIFQPKNTYKNERSAFWGKIFASIFAIMIILANYKIFSGLLDVFSTIATIIMMAGGGYVVADSILAWTSNHLYDFSWQSRKLSSTKPWKYFLICAGAFFLINFVVLVLAKYPGNLTSDTIDQINQIMTGSYSNHHPFYFAMLIKLFLSIGLALFHDMDAAIFLYSVMQIC